MKNPILMVGFLFLTIFIFDLRDRGFLSKRVQSLMPTSCKAVKVRLDRYMHKSWDISCNENNLVIETEVDEKLLPSSVTDIEVIKQKMYKALANNYISISKYAPEESLQRTMMVTLRVDHPKLQINSISEGKHVYNMKSLKNLKNLSRHFKKTVQVQEVTK